MQYAHLLVSKEPCQHLFKNTDGNKTDEKEQVLHNTL